MYKVKRAIIMAAGKGERLRPVTDDTPKPLVRVNGVRMIESVISALHENGIFEIYIVVGYLEKQFGFLETAYPGVRLIRNPDYAAWNNISSLYAARDFLSDCMILDGDQIVYNPDALSPEFERSGYNAVWTSGPTNEWLLRVENGIIKDCSRTGGSDGWQLFSISRWSQADGSRLKRHVEAEYQQGNKSIYWDDLAMFLYRGEYELGIHKMLPGDVLEIDTFDELMMIDPSYSELKAKN